MDLSDLTIHDLSEKLQKGESSSTEILDAVLKRIDIQDPQIHSYNTIAREEALRQAEEADRWIKSKKDVRPLRIISAPKTLKRPAHPGYSNNLSHLTMPPWWKNFARTVRLSSEKRIWMNLLWDPQPRTREPPLPATPGHGTGFREDPQGVLRLQWQPIYAQGHWDRIRVDPSASPLRCAGLSV